MVIHWLGIVLPVVTTAPVVLAAVVGAAMFGSVLYRPLFQQTAQHASVTGSGCSCRP